MNTRIEKLRIYMKNQKLDAVLVSYASNRRYLSGFTGTTANLFITQDEAFFVTDFRYLQQAKTQCKDYEIIDIAQYENYNHFYKTKMANKKLNTIGLEGTYVTYEAYKNIEQALTGYKVVSMNIDHLRLIKDQNEANIIKKANEIAEKAFDYVLKNELRAGRSERTICDILEAKMKEFGASGSSFDTIVASGYRGAMPHGVASDKIINDGDFVTFDFGCIYQGYCSDITRTVVVGNPNNPELKKIYDIVLNAQKIGVAAVKPGVTLGSIDRQVRDYIIAQGYGDKFGHSTGHGLGLDIHELPRVYYPATDIVEEGMVFTIEPGIYIPDLGGVRIEDDVYVTKNGCKLLTTYTKELLVIK